MRVLELAKDIKVETEVLLQLLREMGIAVRGASAQVSEADLARGIARIERGRRAGAKDVFSGEGEVALAMTEAVLRRLGATPDQIDRERQRLHGEFLGPDPEGTR